MLRLEYTAMSLNPKAKLYGRTTLLGMFDRSQPRDRACLEAFERELDMPWALYHVRRLFLLSADGERRPVMRSTERVDLGRPQQLAQRLISVSERRHVDVEHDPLYGPARSWVRHRAKAWPMAEELFATAAADRGRLPPRLPPLVLVRARHLPPLRLRPPRPVRQAARNKLASHDRLARTRNRTPVTLGMPIIHGQA
nr:hypothetical protein [Streptomyces sp. NEAU-HV9]